MGGPEGPGVHQPSPLRKKTNTSNYKGSALRAAVAQGRFQQINGKGAERRGPRFSATSDLIMPRATCAELIDLSVLCCMLAMSRSDRQ